MISDRDHAVAVSRAAEEFIKKLSLALDAMRSHGTNAEVDRLQKAIGEVVGALETELLWPLYKRYPELEPENLKDWRQGHTP